MSSYADYLKSKHWKETRQRKYELRPKRYKCKICGERKNIHLHHKTYKRLGKEHIGQDLIWLCKDCHSLVHKVVKAKLGKRWTLSRAAGTIRKALVKALRKRYWGKGEKTPEPSICRGLTIEIFNRQKA